MSDLKELSLQQLGELLKGWGYDFFHARQVFSWIYKKGAASFREMSDLPQELRRRLEEEFYIFRMQPAEHLLSADGTEKFLFKLEGKGIVEAAVIPAAKRVTGCISTQAGCRFGCIFCASARGGSKKNLTCGEMIEQVLYLASHCRQKKITHLVFMGAGEPLDNYGNLLKAIRIINSPEGPGIGARRITISTCGIIPAIRRLAQERLQVELSVSLHAADERTRSRLMPVNRKYPLKELIAACKGYIQKTKRQITFEYILLEGVNSGLQNARDLVILLKGLGPLKLNLIPANPLKELKARPPEKAKILEFRNYLLKQGVKVTVRRPRGEDIAAACGQLRSRYESK